MTPSAWGCFFSFFFSFSFCLLLATGLVKCYRMTSNYTFRLSFQLTDPGNVHPLNHHGRAFQTQMSVNSMGIVIRERNAVITRASRDVWILWVWELTLVNLAWGLILVKVSRILRACLNLRCSQAPSVVWVWCIGAVLYVQTDLNRKT